MINQEQYPDNKSNHESQFKFLENLYDLSHEMLTLLFRSKPVRKQPYSINNLSPERIRGYETFTLDEHIRCSMLYPLSIIVVLTLHISCSLEPNLTWFTMWTVPSFMVRNGVLSPQVIISSDRDPASLWMMFCVAGAESLLWTMDSKNKFIVKRNPGTRTKWSSNWFCQLNIFVF